MKLKPSLVCFFALTCWVHGQGTLFYDQQSSTNETPLSYGAGPTLQQLAPPYGQSFTPTIAAIDFIRLNLNDHNPNNGVGATLIVTLHANSISGTILGTAGPVFLPNGFTGVTNFFFGSSISLTPNTTYFFQPIVQSGDLWNIYVGELNYPGGTSFYQGSPLPSGDYWFREGIVPEPSSALLALVGGGAFVWFRRLVRRRC